MAPGNFLHRHLFEQGKLRGIAGAFRGGSFPLTRVTVISGPTTDWMWAFTDSRVSPAAGGSSPSRVARSGRMLDWALPEGIQSAPWWSGSWPLWWAPDPTRPKSARIGLRVGCHCRYLGPHRRADGRNGPVSTTSQSATGEGIGLNGRAARQILP